MCESCVLVCCAAARLLCRGPRAYPRAVTSRNGREEMRAMKHECGDFFTSKNVETAKKA